MSLYTCPYIRIGQVQVKTEGGPDSIRSAYPESKKSRETHSSTVALRCNISMLTVLLLSRGASMDASLAAGCEKGDVLSY